MSSLYDKQRAGVLAALNIDPEINAYNLLPAKSFSLSNSDDLSSDQIIEAVRAFCLTLNLTSGNSGGRNLYLLMETYLKNPVARDKINQILFDTQGFN